MATRSAASVAIALDQAVEDGVVERGDLILMVVFGGRPNLGRRPSLNGESFVCSGWQFRRFSRILSGFGID